MASHILFGKNIQPACSYCQNGRAAPDKSMVLCSKYGPVFVHYSCKKYIYDPLKRIPKKPPALAPYSKEDFEL